MHSFPCPNCSTPLRIRDAQRHAIEIQCPDCATALTLQESDGKIIVEPSHIQVDFQPKVVSSPVRFRTLFVLLGGIVFGLIVYNIINSKPKDLTPQPIANDTQLETEEESDLPTEVPPPKEPQVEFDPLQQNLKRIESLITAFRNEHGFFPNGRFLKTDQAEAEFSWIAELLANQQAEQLSLAKDQSWNSPVNDPFVRRRLDFIQNEKIPMKIGSDRYPASHFAGVSGVGADSAKLPKRHPRAGIFSPHRETHLSDILDGTANTILIVGVNSELGSWARPGNSTIRSFTKEPYLNGPDGIGTGQADSMLVLMADGSVRTISSETSPVIIRRMAAMADGLPLNLDTEGDPLEMESITTPPVKAAESGKTDGPPIEPLFAPELPRFDFKKSLSQKLKSFQMEQPKPLNEMLREFQEMLGAPVDWSELDEATLSQMVQLSLMDVTLLDFLTQLSEQAKLNYSLKEDRIKLEKF